MIGFLIFVEPFLEGLYGILLLSVLFPARRKRQLGWQLLRIIFFLCIVVLNGWNMVNYFMSINAVYICITIYTLYISFFFQISVHIALAWEIFYCNVCLLLKTIILLVCACINDRNIFDMNRKYSCSMIIVTIVFLLVLNGSLHYVYRSRNFRCVLEELIKCRYWMLIITGIVEYGFVIFIFNIAQYNVGIWEIVTGAICVFSIVVLFYVQLLLMRYQMMSREKTIIGLQKNIAEQQFFSLKEQYQDSRKKLHSRKYELQHLLGLLKKGNMDDVVSYTENALQQVIDLQKQVIYTGQVELDVLLSVSKQRCMEKKIDFQVNCNILHEIPVEMSDMYVLIGNLLDNAFEAVAKCSESNRYIELTLKLQNEMLLLKISNSYFAEPIQNADGSFRSLKPGLEHGWGLESVRDIVKKHEGTMDIEFFNHRFDVTILI